MARTMFTYVIPGELYKTTRPVDAFTDKSWIQYPTGTILMALEGPARDRSHDPFPYAAKFLAGDKIVELRAYSNSWSVIEPLQNPHRRVK